VRTCAFTVWRAARVDNIVQGEVGLLFQNCHIKLATPTKTVSPYMITAASVSPKDYLPVTNPLPLSPLPLANRAGIWLNLPFLTPTDIPAVRKVQKNCYVLLPHLSSETTDGGIGPPRVDVVFSLDPPEQTEDLGQLVL
jgi:hypothetical protein